MFTNLIDFILFIKNCDLKGILFYLKTKLTREKKLFAVNDIYSLKVSGLNNGPKKKKSQGNDKIYFKFIDRKMLIAFAFRSKGLLLQQYTPLVSNTGIIVVHLICVQMCVHIYKTHTTTYCSFVCFLLKTLCDH